MADGQVVFEITGDAKGINQTVKQVTSDIQSESKKWDQAAGSATSGIEKSFASMAGNIVGSLTAAGIGAILLNWGKAAVDAASDLSEVQNVVDTVFGEGASRIDAWAKDASRQFGLTETQAKKFTSTLGAMMKSSGLAGNEIVNMSTDLAGLAADMASFYNLDFETAFEKIRSGISGETMPLKQLGINMSTANLEAFALAQGLEKTFAQMDQGEQTMLRYQYLMQATSDAQGDFAKTADGFANAQRRIESSIESIKTNLGMVLLPVVETVTSAVAGMLEKITAQPERTLLDDFNDIEVDTATKMADLEATYSKAQDIIGLLDEISKQTVTLKDGSTLTFEELFEDIGNVEKNGGDVRGYLEDLGVDVDYVINKYNVWKESTRQLTSLVPELASAINSETGAIDGGTEALQKNLDEWKAYQEKKIAWAAYYAKEQALAEKKASMYMYEFDAGAARQAAKKAADAIKNVWKLELNDNGYFILPDEMFTMRQEDYDQMMRDIEHYNILLAQQQEAEEELAAQTQDYSEAEKHLADGKQALIDKYGEEERAATEAANATSAFMDKSADDWKKLLTAAGEASTALADYVKGVKDGTEQAVNSVVKGFEKITRPTTELEKKRDKLIQQQQEVNQATKEGKQKYEELEKQINELNKSIDEYKPKGMQDALESQLAFMKEYTNNLEKARNMGLSNELLASLSDGSVESAEYLSQLVSDEAGAKEVDKLFKEVQDKKKEFTDALTEQKLTVDQTYEAMLEKAMSTIENLNLGDEASQAMSGTVEGIANGIALAVPEVQAAVDSLIAQLDRLSAYGMGFEFDSDGFLTFSLDGSHATGLNYVPFDGYLAQLHEGEGILTAEENRIWQRFRNGQGSSANVDYEMLGGVMRDNVKAGGNVYLDGRTVGSVISDAQGRSYRALQRSGWQG